MKGYRFFKTVWAIFLAVFLGTALPGNSADKNSETLRENAVARMREMAAILWTPTEDIKYWNEDYSDVFFKKGVLYEGIPYTQRNRETTPELFRENINEAGLYVGPANYPGTDCSSSVTIAWRTFDPELPYLRTYMMFPGKTEKIVAVGDYKITSTKSTPQIISDNGEERIRAAYDQLKPGDAVTLHKNGDGHVRMVTKVDPEKQQISIIEQTGVNQAHQFKGKRGTWRVDYPFSYDELLKDGYIPITHKALAD